MRTAVITPVAGRHDHLRQQRRGLQTGSCPPDLHVVVAMGDPAIEGVLYESESTLFPTLAIDVGTRDGRLPLAHARNRGARRALEEGAEILVFLDVDCIPGASTLQRYVDNAQDTSQSVLLSGPVSYLPPPAPGGYDLSAVARTPAHPARPVPDEHSVIGGADHKLFWSLSFAVRSSTWNQIGGFCERYEGYGGEDTDFAQVAASRHVEHVWIGGAWTYHQYHATSTPPVQHLDDVLRNAAIFHQRWGWWPMMDWLQQFQELALARFDPIANTWLRCDPPDIRDD